MVFRRRAAAEWWPRLPALVILTLLQVRKRKGMSEFALVSVITGVSPVTAYGRLYPMNAYDRNEVTIVLFFVTALSRYDRKKNYWPLMHLLDTVKKKSCDQVEKKQIHDLRGLHTLKTEVFTSTTAYEKYGVRLHVLFLQAAAHLKPHYASRSTLRY